MVVDVDGEEKIVTGNECVASVTFEQDKPPVVTPTKPEAPTELPDTGPGDVVVAFLAVTIGSSVAYYAVVRRFAGL